jgi:putative ABC transport system ATP-binding protein
MSAENAISMESVVVEYLTPVGAVRALDRLSLALDGGSSLAITGPSGSGKSTMLGLLAGLSRPTAGAVRMGGQDVSSLSDGDSRDYRRHHIGYVYQANNLLPFLTVLENVQLPLTLVGQYGDVHRSRQLLDRLGLAELADRLPDQLSGGQQQRVAVAKAVVHRPTVILADEPTGALDSRNAAGVVQLLLDMQTDLAATLVMVTHDPAAASRLDQQLELVDGRLR